MVSPHAIVFSTAVARDEWQPSAVLIDPHEAAEVIREVRERPHPLDDARTLTICGTEFVVTADGL
jgi:hypothetical protein